MAQQMNKAGWFGLPGRPGDRTLDQQLVGLETLLATVGGKTVLDVGCAEGLISMELARYGASVHGVEVVEDHVRIGKKLVEQAGLGGKVLLECGDANSWSPRGAYEVTIMLALLHKLRDPSAAARRFAMATSDLIVLRLPPEHAPIIIDQRSGNIPHNVGKVIEDCGFELVRQLNGTFGEWIGYYERVRA
jgi:SAM-dependent methyltransferase